MIKMLVTEVEILRKVKQMHRTRFSAHGLTRKESR